MKNCLPFLRHILANRWSQLSLAVTLGVLPVALLGAALVLPPSEAAAPPESRVSASSTLGAPHPLAQSIATREEMTHTLYLPMLTRDLLGPIATIEWESPDGYRLLDGAIVPTTTLTVSITLLADLETITVTLTPGGGTPEDISSQFGDLLSAGQAAATLTLSVGQHTLTVEGTRNGEQLSESARMLTFDNAVIAVGPAEILPIVSDGDAWVEKDTVIVIFERAVDYLTISQVLRDERLDPVGFNFVTYAVRARITDGRSPSDVAAALSPKAGVQAATPNFAVQVPVTLGESMPTRLRGAYYARAGARCTPGDGDLRGCFDYDGLDSTNELRIFRQHFLMDTFAGHRLVAHLVPTPTVRPAIADVDSGVGNGANSTDIPIGPTGLYGFSRAPFTWDNAGMQTGAGVLGIANVADTVAGGHGTQVVAAAAGRGTAQVLGTGKDLRVRPIRYTGAGAGTAQDAANAIVGACRDSAVAVVVMEIWNPLDNPEPFADTNGNGVRDGGELFTDWNGDGLWTGRDGVIAPAERAAHAANVPGLVAILQPAIDFCRNPFVDTGRDGNIAIVDADGSQGDKVHQVGEPFADTDGDGNFLPDRDGKILAAPLGNDGENLNALEIPSRFVPARPRPAGDPYVFGVSASETVGNADTTNNVRGPEGLASYSNFGPRVSVSALGTQVILPDPAGNLGAIDGTSFSTPIAAGLVGETVFLDRNLRPPSGRFSPLQIIEITEATADDLGSSVGANNAAKPNDRPGNGRDDAFGYGRINVWKAILAVANAGLARESHTVNPDGYATDFPSLPTITDADTLWYGFKIHSPVLNATVWLDGVQLTDNGSTDPGTPSITAYAGVQSDRVIMIGMDDDNDGILDEDPTSGIVPVGNERGEYLATFSIEGHQLRAAEKLELRTGNDRNEPPFYVLDVSNTQAMRNGDEPGVVFDDHVFYVTPTDFGDADPTQSYDVRLEDGIFGGAHHLNATLEWFGRPGRPNEQSVSSEVDADDEKDSDTVPNVKDEAGEDEDIWNMDARDDGVVLHTETFRPGLTGRATFTLCVADEDSGRYGATLWPWRSVADGSLYLNAWIDWNADGDWDDDRESILDGAQVVPAPTNFIVQRQPTGTATIATTGGVISHCQEFEAQFPLPAAISGDGLWARFRLDYGEDGGDNDPGGYDSFSGLSGYSGPARYGEVEDYSLKGEFGDADPQYPTKLRDNGARHVETKHEWFGQLGKEHDKSVGEEHDAVDPTDIDGTPNLRDDGYDLDRFDDGILFYPLTYRPNERGKLAFNVCVDEVGGRYDPDDPDKSLYVNAWIDWDTDWTWEEDNEEHIINGLRLAPEDATSWGPLGLRITGTTTITVTDTSTKCARYLAEFDVGATPPLTSARFIGTGKLWSRFRVDYGEDVGRNDPRPLFRSDDSLRDPALPITQTQPPGQGIGYTQGAARFGEVEDHQIGSDFGDAPDPFTAPGQYPTRKASVGARHLDINREWLGTPGIYASVTRETDGCDLTLAEEDRVPNLGDGCDGSDVDSKDDGAVVPFAVQPGQTVLVDIDVSAQVDSRGFANRGPGGEDSKGTQTLMPSCTLAPIPDMPDTPIEHRDRGRYSAWDSEKRLYLNVWADWNANGLWEAGELVISGPLDPEVWGADGKYTLGEPFDDQDGNKVRTEGEVYTDTAGISLHHLQCPVDVPLDLARGMFWWRFRLDYGENVRTYDAVIHHATEDARLLWDTHGGALWGEVEDYPSICSGKASAPEIVTLGDTIEYAVTLPANAALEEPAGAWINDALPEFVQFVEGSLTCTTGDCQYSEGSHTVTWEGDLGPHQAVEMEYDLTVSEEIPPPCPQTIENYAETFDGATTRVFSTATTLLAADLSVTKSDSPDPVFAGKPLTYTIVAANNGPVDATGVTVSDTLPNGVTFVSSTPLGTCTEEGGTVICNLGSLASGESVIITLVVTVDPLMTGMLANSVEVAASEPDPNPADNAVTVSTEVCPVIIDLGTLGGTESYARAINSTGEVVGRSYVTSDAFYRAFIWRKSGGMLLRAGSGAMIDLGALPGDTHSAAFDVNDSGRVVGSSHGASEVDHAFLWSESGGMENLGTLGGDNSVASSINNSNLVAGWSDVDPLGNFHAFLWNASGGLTDLGTLSGGAWSQALHINNSGQVVGLSTTADWYVRAVLWNSGNGIQDLGVLPGCTDSRANGINDAGQVVGASYTAAGTPQAFLWTEGGGATGLGEGWIAHSINDSGQVVGALTVDGVSAGAVLWQDGDLIQLNDLLPPGSGWVLEEARDITNRGGVVGHGLIDGQVHAFYLALTEDACLPAGPGPASRCPEVTNRRHLAGYEAATADTHVVTIERSTSSLRRLPRLPW